MIQVCRSSIREAEAALAGALCELQHSQMSSELVTGGFFSSSLMNNLPLRALALLSPCPAHRTCVRLMILHHCPVDTSPIVNVVVSASAECNYCIQEGLLKSLLHAHRHRPPVRGLLSQYQAVLRPAVARSIAKSSMHSTCEARHWVIFLCQTPKSKDVAPATTQELDFSTTSCNLLFPVLWHGSSLAPAHGGPEATVNRSTTEEACPGLELP